MRQIHTNHSSSIKQQKPSTRSCTDREERGMWGVLIGQDSGGCPNSHKVHSGLHPVCRKKDAQTCPGINTGPRWIAKCVMRARFDGLFGDALSNLIPSWQDLAGIPVMSCEACACIALILYWEAMSCKSIYNQTCLVWPPKHLRTRLFLPQLSALSKKLSTFTAAPLICKSSYPYNLMQHRQHT